MAKQFFEDSSMGHLKSRVLENSVKRFMVVLSHVIKWPTYCRVDYIIIKNHGTDAPPCALDGQSQRVASWLLSVVKMYIASTSLVLSPAGQLAHAACQHRAYCQAVTVRLVTVCVLCKIS